MVEACPSRTRGRWPRHRFFPLLPALLGPALLFAGCGGSRQTTTPATEEHLVVTRAARFHVPAGWLDFSTDSLGILWLVRKDYQASLTVEEVQTAGEAADPLPIARALLQMERAERHAQAAAPAAADRTRPGKVALFQAVREGGDEVRVAVVRSGSKLFSVTALQRAGAPGAPEDISAVWQGIIGDLLP